MRILHTSDWHIGRALDGRKRYEEFELFLDWLIICIESEEIEALKARLETVENSPAAPKVFTNGAVPPAGMLRGQDQAAGGQPVDVAKARERKAELYAASGPDQARIAKEMTEGAIGVYEAMRAAR